MNAFAGLRAFCFDLDDTFWDCAPVLARAEIAVLEFLRERYPRLAEGQTRESLMRRRHALALAEPARAHDLTWLRIEAMRRYALEFGYPAGAGEEAFDVFITIRNDVQIYTDVLPALQRLGRAYPLATLSNGNADLARIGLAAHFERCLNAENVGHAKPDARAFHAAARALGVEPGEMAYVGDDPLVDVEGARRAGLRTIWINRAGREWPAGAAPADLEIRDLGVLAAAFEGEAAARS